MRALFGLIVVLLAGEFSFAASTNDSFASRVILRGSLPIGSGNISGATRESGEPHPHRASLWWEWTPAFDGGVSITTQGSPTRPAALVYTGVWPNLTLISAPRPSTTFFQPANVSFYARSNVTVYIALAAHPTLTIGTVSLRAGSVAFSDNFARAIPISSTNLTSTTGGGASTIEPGEIASSTNVAGTVWWKWTVPVAGRYLMQVSSEGSTLNPPGVNPNLVLYQGTALTNLTRIAFASHDAKSSNSRMVLDLAAGTYYIAAEDFGYHAGAALVIRTAPLNDDFASRIVLPPEAEVSTNFNVTAATREAAEPATTNKSVWWEWSAPYTGSFALDVSSSAFNNWTPEVEVFQGTELTNLVRVAPAGEVSPITFAALRAVAGQTYIIRVTAPYYAAGGVTLRIRPGALNDDFANAVVLEGSSIQTNGTPLGATYEPGEFRPPEVGGGTIWWTWTPTNSGAYSIEAESGAVYVYRGDALTNLTLAAGDPMLGSHRVSARLEAGERVYIQVRVGATTTADFVLSIDSGPSNDDFANAVLITTEQTVGSSRGASLELGEPLGGGLGHTVWYRWQPTNTSGYEIKLETPAVLSVYSGESLTNLTLLGRVAGANNSGGFFADASRTYYIALDSQISGGTQLSFQITEGPANDKFAARTTIAAIDQWFTGTSFGTTREAGEPNHDAWNPPSRTAWFEWTAPTTGGFYIEVWESPSPPAQFAVYQGTELTNMVSVPSYDHVIGAPRYQRYISFRAIEGQKYAIVLFDHEPREAQFIIRPTAGHDEFANAREVFLQPPFQGVTTGATLEPGEPTNIFGGTLWHRFTAPTNGSYIVFSDHLFRVYRGTNLTEPIEPVRFPFVVVPFRAVAGETFYISVVAGFPSTYSVRIDPAVANDDFANATELTNVVSLQNPEWSTIEPGEPIYPTNYNASVWWRWKPASNGFYRIAAFTGHHSAYLGIYEGSNLSNLNLRASTSSLSAETLIVELAAEAGEEFSIVLAHQPAYGNHASIAIYHPAANDDFSSPLIIGNEPATNAFEFATSEPGEPDPGFETVWYSWTAPSTDNYVFKPTGDNVSPQFIKVFTGTELTNLTTVAEVIGGTGVMFPGPSLAFRAVEGTTYRMAIGFLRSTITHSILASVESGHADDDFVERTQVSGQFVAWNNTTVGSTIEPGEEAIVGEAGAYPASIWAEWTAPVAGVYKLVARPSDLQPMSIRVFRGETLDSLQQVSFSGGRNIATFSAVVGEKYHIRLASAALSVGFFSLRLGPLATNESPVSAIPLEGTPVAVTGQNWTATSTPPQPSHLAGLWYTWTAPANGFLTYWTAKTYPASVSVFHTRTPTINSNVTTEVVRTWEPIGDTIAVSGGMTYLIYVSSIASTNLPLNLTFEEDPVETTLEGALLGGTELWRLQPDVFGSGLDALEALPLPPGDEAWIEFVFNRPGTLRFKSKMMGNGGVLFSRAWPFTAVGPGTVFTVTQPHDWTARALNLRARTNVVRLTFTGSSDWLRPTSIAWLDDFEFLPLTAPALNVQIDPENPESINLSLLLEPQRVIHLDISSNLIDWEPWTNASSATATTRTINLQTLTNSLLFFRSRVHP